MKAWAFVFGTLLGGALVVSACGGSGTGSGFTGADAGPGDATLLDASQLNFGEAGLGSCNHLTCAKLGYTCGQTGDGCGGTINCGTCTAPETCGGGGKFSVCGGAGPCKPKTCADLGFNCGPAGDGCGGLLTCGANGGKCTAPAICGGGGLPGVCGSNGAPHPDGGLDGGPCVPETCASQAISCGPAGDGCGNLLTCESCTTSGQTCGGGGTSGVCGAPPACVPKTCTQLGYNCGPAGDGCGGLIASCGTCTGSQECGVGTKPGVCATPPSCTNLCPSQVLCDGGGTTTLTGKVVAGTLSTYIPAGQSADPIPNVIVYVPNGTPSAFTQGVECNACGAEVTGSPLVQATTDYQGNFTLTNVPVPASGTIPLVIQLGRWRRIFGLGNALNPGFHVNACTTNAAGQIRMPRNHSEGDIPLTAISTGQIDPMECVLLKMGVDQAEFTNPSGGGRVQIYQGNGSFVSPSSPAETALVPDSPNATSVLEKYDQVLFPCWGADPILSLSIGGTDNVKTANQQQNVVSYANAGGRIFGTHLSYSWLYLPTATPFNKTATWTGDPLTSAAGHPEDLEYDNGTAVIPSTSTVPDVATFYKWMNALAWNGATTGTFPIIQERNNFSAVGAGSQLWASVTNATTAISGEPTSFPAVYTFNTPYSTATPPPTQCGKVIYSDFHVSVIAGGGSDDEADAFPTECTSAPMSAQEKALEYLIWDLASCPSSSPPVSTCTPKTCAQLGIGCGPAGDGCGNVIQCGGCTPPATCGGGGTPSQCGGTGCTPETCVSQHIECGPAGDGCGNQLDCGGCRAPLTCGGGGINGKCGSLDSGPTCQALTCQGQGITCGPAGDGCGNKLDCGSCAAGQACGAGGKPGVCAPVCVPKTCAQLGFNCGPTGDGCGHELQCGTCKAPQTCGGGGKTSVCGGNSAK